jgi:hypothetical protein
MNLYGGNNGKHVVRTEECGWNVCNKIATDDCSGVGREELGRENVVK